MHLAAARRCSVFGREKEKRKGEKKKKKKKPGRVRLARSQSRPKSGYLSATLPEALGDQGSPRSAGQGGEKKEKGKASITSRILASTRIFLIHPGPLAPPHRPDEPRRRQLKAEGKRKKKARRGKKGPATRFGDVGPGSLAARGINPLPGAGQDPRRCWKGEGKRGEKKKKKRAPASGSWRTCFAEASFPGGGQYRIGGKGGRKKKGRSFSSLREETGEKEEGEKKRPCLHYHAVFI